MVQNKKNKSSGSWKKERASVNSKNKARPRSNKNRPDADKSQRAGTGSTSSYWRAGYTRKDGTRVKGHYVKSPK